MTKNKVQFNIIEGEPDDYWDHYEAFVKLYNDEKHSVTDIQKIIQEELQKRPNYMDMKMSKLCLIIKRRCMSEL